MSPATTAVRVIGTSASWRACLIALILRLLVKRRLPTDLAGLRGRVSKADRAWFRVPHDVRRTQVNADGVACEWVDAAEAPSGRVILYLHGGGFAVHLPAMYAGFAARLGRKLNARVLLVDYRLAPEHPFPSAVEDCHAAYRWLLGQGIAPDDIVIAGDSAGGNLTLVTLLRIKAAGEPRPACAVAISPGVDLTMSSPSVVENERRDALLPVPTIQSLVAAYASEDERLDPFVSPLFGDVSGLPPLLLQAGTDEILRDDAVRFGTLAQQAGVETEVELWRGMQHCFQLLRFIPESGRALESIRLFVQRHVAGPVLTQENAP